MNDHWRDTIVGVAWAICGIVAVLMICLFIMQSSAESARFWEACVNTGGMTIGNNCVKPLGDIKEAVQ